MDSLKHMNLWDELSGHYLGHLRDIPYSLMRLWMHDLPFFILTCLWPCMRGRVNLRWKEVWTWRRSLKVHVEVALGLNIKSSPLETVGSLRGSNGSPWPISISSLCIQIILLWQTCLLSMRLSPEICPQHSLKSCLLTLQTHAVIPCVGSMVCHTCTPCM